MRLIKWGKINSSRILLFCLGFLFINTFTYLFISNEKWIYYWDYYHYWEKYQRLGDLLIHSPGQGLSELWLSIRYDDYTLLPVLFLVPFRFLFGDSRLGYILAISNMYVLPSAILCSVLVRRLTFPSRQKDLFPSLVSISTLLLLPQFWVPVLLGYPDAAGVVLIFSIFLTIYHKPIEKMNIPSVIALGLLLALLVLLRRWYAYWVVAFFIAIAVEKPLALFRWHRFDLKSYFPVARNLVILGMAATAIFFLLATPLALRMISTNYSDIYSAYKSATSLRQMAMAFYGYFGPAITALFVAGLFYGIFMERTRFFFVFLIIQCIAVTGLFSRVQDFNAHHCYLFMPTMAFAISFFVSDLLSLIESIPLKIIFSTVYLVSLTIQFLSVFIPGVADAYSKVTPLFSEYRHYPLVRNDLGEFKRLIDVLADLTKDNTRGIYVIGSSIIFNDDILKNACGSSPAPKELCEKILHSSHVDKRDGFPKDFLSAGYVVVSDPIQYHLRPEDQRVTGILADEIMHAKGMGTSFDRLPYQFFLDNDVKVYIYRKTRPFREADLTNIKERFLSFYPDKKDIFSVFN